MPSLVVAPHRGKSPFNNHTLSVIATEMRLLCYCNLEVTVAAPFGSVNYWYIAFRYGTVVVLLDFRGLAVGRSLKLRSPGNVTVMSV
jgi:hypothetical protein